MERNNYWVYQKKFVLINKPEDIDNPNHALLVGLGTQYGLELHKLSKNSPKYAAVIWMSLHSHSYGGTAPYILHNGKYIENYIVKKLELELLSPETRKSPKRLNELLADDFFEFTQSGTTHTKQDIIDGLPKRSEEQFMMYSYTEKILSDVFILVHYIVDGEILETGKKRCTLCSSVWQKRNDNWQMIFFQGTPAKIT
jgi:hypothetical protein